MQDVSDTFLFLHFLFLLYLLTCSIFRLHRDFLHPMHTSFALGGKNESAVARVLEKRTHRRRGTHIWADGGDHDG